MSKSKKSLLCFTIVLALLFCNVPTAFGASTMSPWAENEINEAIGLGLIPEDMQNKYTKNIKRAEFCRLTVVLLEEIYDSKIEEILIQRDLTIDSRIFTDTQDEGILAANALGIVFGDGKGIFNPDGEIKRGEAAAMLMRTASLTGEYSALPHVFDDAAWFPVWARGSAYEAYAYDIMVGDNMNRFHPVSFYTRQETYATILRLYHTIQNGTKEKEALYPMSVKGEDEKYLWGYINQNGTFVIEPKYAYASEWNGEYGIVSPPDEPDAHLVIDREENHVLEVNELRELTSDRDGNTTPYFLGNTLYVGGYDKVLFSLPDGKWLTGDFKGGGATHIMDGIIRAYDGFGHVVYYLDRNGQSIVSREEGFWFGGYSYKSEVIIGDSSGSRYWLWSIGGEKKPVIIDAEKGIFPEFSKTVGDFMTVSGPRRMVGYDFLPSLYGVIRADGKEILPPVYETLILTPSKRILAQKNALEPYLLFDETGKKIFEFDSSLDGNLLFDNIGYYMFSSGDTMLTVISNTGAVMSNIEVGQNTTFQFIGGLIQITDINGACSYYTVDGAKALLSE